MTPLEELAKLISEKGRKILVAENPVDLRALHGENSVFILQLPEGSTAAGGRESHRHHLHQGAGRSEAAAGVVVSGAEAVRGSGRRHARA